MESKKKARQGCNQGRAKAISNEEYTTFGVGLAFMFAAFFAWVLLDMAVSEIKLAEQQGREATDGMRKVWDWEHGRIVDKTAAVRNLLMMLNG